MPPKTLKTCVVGNCTSTNRTNRLFNIPRNDDLRKLWMSVLCNTNHRLLLLEKNQLIQRCVCAKHFEVWQIDKAGKRHRNAVPSLFTEQEIKLGVPHVKQDYQVLHEHNYVSKLEQGDRELVGPPVVLRNITGLISQEHLYCAQSSGNIIASTSASGQEAMSLNHSGPSSTIENGLISQEHLYCAQSSSNIIASTSASVQEAMSLNHSEPSSTIENGLISQEHLYCAQSSSNIIASTSVSGQEAMSLNHSVPSPTIENELIPKVTSETSEKMQSPKKQSIKQYSSRARRVIKEFTKIAHDNLGESSRKRLQNATTLMENSFLMENFHKLNNKAKSFLLMQLKLARKNKLSRRFCLEEKLLALALMKHSPKGYKLLEQIFALPNKRTLSRLAEMVTLECGLNEKIFQHINSTTKNWDTRKRLCTVLFDEVALTPHLTFSEKRDHVNGFVEIAGERNPKIADHALVFMVRGICSPWRQTIAYYFCEGTVSAAELQRILKEIIPKLKMSGLNPLGLVSDQGSTFRSCYKALREATIRFRSINNINDDGTINIEGVNLFIFHDAPHLIKGIRNNFLEKDILFKGKRGSWKDIEYIYDLDCKLGHTRALPKLTAQHVERNKIRKMKVKDAVQVLSGRTAAMLAYTKELHKRLNVSNETMGTTAAVVEFFDELFDSVNGSPCGTKGKLRNAVKKNSLHLQFWSHAINILKDVKFIDENSKLAKQAGKPRYVRVPSLEGWNTTLKSFIGISNLLFKKYNIEFFYPRFLNQDPLENFFGRIRAMNYRNNNPDPNAFIYSFKSLVISNIISPHSKNANCEEDDGETLVDFNYLFGSNKENTVPNLLNVPSSSVTSVLDNDIRFTMEDVVSEKIKVQTSAYTAGYISKKLLKKINCNSCAETFMTKEVQGIHKYIEFREFKRLKNKNLCYPNERILQLYRKNSQQIHLFLDEYAYCKNIKYYLTNTILHNTDMTWLGCNIHKRYIKKLYMNLIIRLHCHNWCNKMNRILKGKYNEKYINLKSPLQVAAVKKYKVYRLRKKCLNK